MVFKQTKLKITDNSGARLIKVFHLFKYSVSQKYSSSGDVVLGSIKKYKSHKKLVKKQICTGLIITSKKNILRQNGNFIKFDETRGVLLTRDCKKLLGTRIFGPISKEIRRGTYSRILSISKNII